MSTEITLGFTVSFSITSTDFSRSSSSYDFWNLASDNIMNTPRGSFRTSWKDLFEKPWKGSFKNVSFWNIDIALGIATAFFKSPSFHQRFQKKKQILYKSLQIILQIRLAISFLLTLYRFRLISSSGRLSEIATDFLNHIHQEFVVQIS